jgi:hypothetical protein
VCKSHRLSLPEILEDKAKGKKEKKDAFKRVKRTLLPDIAHQKESHRFAVMISLPEISEDKAEGKKDSFKMPERTLLPDIVDQKEVITLVRDDKKIGFLYMIYAVPRSSKFYSPYCLTYVKLSLNIQH